MANFGPKPWTNPFGNISIFGLFQLLLLIAYKSIFSLWNVIKNNLLKEKCREKKDRKWPILDQNHGPNPFGKISIFQGFILLVFKAKNGVFLL